MVMGLATPQSYTSEKLVQQYLTWIGNETNKESSRPFLYFIVTLPGTL